MVEEVQTLDAVAPIGLEASFQYDDDGLQIDARKLWGFLGVETQFRDWIARRIEVYEFQEGEDFRSKMSESTGGRPSKEYLLTTGMAKELCMVESNEKGKQARRYFIAVEKRAKLLTQRRLDTSQTHLDRIFAETMAVMKQLGSGLSTKFEETNGKIEKVSEKVEENTAAIESLEKKVVHRKAFSKKTIRVHIDVLLNQYGWKCPSCNQVQLVDGEGRLSLDAEKDHYYNKSNANLTATWIICKECNRKKEHSFDMAEMKIQFEAYQLQVKRFLEKSNLQIGLFE